MKRAEGRSNGESWKPERGKRKGKREEVRDL
jgi:hypothetical protein